MSEVVVISAKADTARADAASSALASLGLKVLVNPAPGRARAEALNRASCVVALLSRASVADELLQQEIRAAGERHALVPVQFEGAVLPPDLRAPIIDMAAAKGLADGEAFTGLLHAVREQADKSPGLSREEFLQSFFFFGGLHFGLTLDDAVKRFGLPNESTKTMLAYEHGHAEGPGLVLVQTHEESKLISFMVVHGQGGIDFLAAHNVVDPRLAFIGLHKDEIFRILGAPNQNIGELDDGRICFGYSTMVGIQATSPNGEEARFALVIYVLFYVTSRDLPFCGAMSVQWDPVPLPEPEST